MKELHYDLMDPTGNMTVLVETPVPVAQQPAVATKIMELESLCEQVGFLMPAVAGCDTAIRMAGGEFCGNASMCAAALYAIKQGFIGEKKLRISVSGKSVMVAVAPDDAGYLCRVEMPRLLDVVQVDQFPVVRFEGICHAITTAELSDEDAVTLLRGLCDVLQPEAIGLMQLGKEGDMKPLVYVPAADTLFWENSCGSGTAAVGAYLYHLTGKPVSCAFRQPGGTLGVEVDDTGRIFLQGTARLVHHNTIAYP